MRRRTFLRNLAAAVVIPWTRALAPAVCEPALLPLFPLWTITKVDMAAKEIELDLINEGVHLAYAFGIYGSLERSCA